MQSASVQSIRAIDLGRMPYAEAFDYQRHLHAQVVAGNAPPTLLLLEHDPVITISRRKAAPRHLLASQQELSRRGIDVQPTDRGGDITYHGPGQLVAYPIVRLNPLGLNVGRYMRLLEQIVIDTAAAFGVEGQRVEGATGVWAEESADCDARSSPFAPRKDVLSRSERRLAKLAAIGVRISRGVSLHGLALNVTTDLSHYDTIVPCGLANRAVTSLGALLGEAAAPMQKVKDELVRAAQAHLRCDRYTSKPMRRQS